MALSVILKRREIDIKRKELDALKAREAEFGTRAAELETAVAEAEDLEQCKAIEEEVSKLDTERGEWGAQVSELETAIGGLEEELRALEAQQDTKPPAEPVKTPEPENEERSGDNMIRMNRALARMSAQERTAFVEREDIKSYLAEVRGCIREKRALTNVGLTVPTVMLGLLKENIGEYSKLAKHVNLVNIQGEGRQLVMGSVPEAIWTECCANINELDLAFNDVELDCFMVAGYFAVCNANIEDSDIDLVSELMDALGAAIGKALDKAILYGRNGDNAQKMPKGIITRLAETSQPASYPSTARAWADLHTSNIKTISSGTTGKDLFAAILINAGAAKNDYARGDLLTVMNDTTYAYLMGQAMQVDAQGAIVSKLNGTMPGLGGQIEILNWMPDYVMVTGYFDLYTLAERAGAKFAQSEHVRFLQNQTVFKGVARYDGQPAIAEAFVAIGVNSTTPAKTDVTFAPDSANSVQSIALNTSTLSIAGTASKQLYAITAPGSGTVTWTSGTTAKATVDDNGVVTGVSAGTSKITATCNGMTAECIVTVT